MIDGKRGISITEVIVATAISVFVIGGALAVYLMSSSAWKEGYVQIELQQEASMAIEQMARGVDGQNGIREATGISIGTGSIEYTGTDAQDRKFALDSGEIRYYPDSSDTGTWEVIAGDVDTLTFSEPGSGLVKIDLRLLKDVGDKDLYIDLSTQITLRND